MCNFSAVKILAYWPTDTSAVAAVNVPLLEFMSSIFYSNARCELPKATRVFAAFVRLCRSPCN